MKTIDFPISPRRAEQLDAERLQLGTLLAELDADIQTIGNDALQRKDIVTVSRLNKVAQKISELVFLLRPFDAPPEEHKNN